MSLLHCAIGFYKGSLEDERRGKYGRFYVDKK